MKLTQEEMEPTQEKSPQEYKDELKEAFNAWSEGLGKYSIQAAYAIIAANWAAHTSTSSIMRNSWAKLSIGVCVGYIVLNIFLVWIITEGHYKQSTKAEANDTWWKEEYENRATTKFPYTGTIETLSLVLRVVKGLAPIIAGVLFVISLF